MSDLRPRPQYGEYASSEERLAAGGLPLEASPPSPDTRIDPALLVAPAAPLGADQPGAKQPGAKPASYDPAITAGLLGFGLVFLVTSVVPASLDFAASAQQAFTQLDIGTFTNVAAASSMGIVILVANTVIYIAAAVASYRRVRAGKRAFYIPIAGAVLAALVSGVLASIVLTGDPAMIELLNTR